jgi:hypothetical protein
MQKRALPEADAADYIGYSKWYLRECRSGRLGPGLKFIKIGRSIRYLKEDLDAWLDGFKQQNGAA